MLNNPESSGSDDAINAAAIRHIFKEADALVDKFKATINLVVAKLDSIIPKFGVISNLNEHAKMPSIICLIYVATIGKSAAGAFQALDELQEQIANTKTITPLKKAMTTAQLSIKKIVSTIEQREQHVEITPPVETLIGGVWHSLTSISPKDLIKLDGKAGTLGKFINERRALLKSPTTETTKELMQQNEQGIFQYLHAKDQRAVEKLIKGITQQLSETTRLLLTKNISLRERTFAKEADGKQEAIESIVQTRVKGFSECNKKRIRTGWQVLEDPSLKVDFGRAQEDVLVATILSDTGVFYQSQQGEAPGKAFRKALKKTLCSIIAGKVPLETCIEQVYPLFPFDNRKDMDEYIANIREDIRYLKANGKPAPLPVLDILTDFYGHPEKQKEWMIRYGHLHCLHSGYQGVVVMKDAEICSYYGDPSGFNKSVRALHKGNLEPSPPFATIFMMQTLALEPEKIPALVSGEQLLKKCDRDAQLGEHQTQLTAIEKALIGEEVLSLLRDGKRLLQASADKSQSLYKTLHQLASAMMSAAEDGEVSGGVLEMHMQNALGPILNRMMKTAPNSIVEPTQSVGTSSLALKRCHEFRLESDSDDEDATPESSPDSVMNSPLAEAVAHGP